MYHVSKKYTTTLCVKCLLIFEIRTLSHSAENLHGERYYY